MSRWQTEFDQHPFQADWKALVNEALELQVDDQTVLTSVQEVARLKRVIEYLRSIIESIDVELVPKSVWDSFHGQCAACLQQVRNFQSNRNVSHLQAANQHLDNLLSYVRPYMVFPEAAITALASSAQIYRSQLEEFVNAFSEKSTANAVEVKQNLENSKALLSELERNKARVDVLVAELVDGTPENESTQNAVNTIKEKIDEQAADIGKFYDDLFLDDSETGNITKDIREAKEKILADHTEIKRLLSTTQEQVNHFNSFHTKIFGEKDAEGKIVGGLESELNARTLQLTKLESEHIKKYQALYDRVEDLLPGATSAGLAVAYKQLRRSFAHPIRTNTQLFYVAIGLMPLVALISSVQNFSIWPFDVTFIGLPNVEAILKAFFLKLPFIAPLIWLAIFASVRRSQYERLQQEYAHKEALAKSYESYKKQLEALLSTDAEPLQKELIAKAIEAISFNASSTLDKRHHDKMPLEHALETLGSDKAKQLLEQVRSFFPASKP